MPVHVLIDDPLPRVRRITLNRPEKRNALSNLLRKEILEALQEADRDPEISIMIVRGAGPCFSAGYDLSADNRQGQPYHTSGGAGQWSRHVVDGWFTIWDLAKPVIAQVHGYCLAGGSELATACDVVFVAEDAQIGYPPVRLMSPPDMQYHPWLVGMRRAMELMLTGDAMSGREAAEWGFATRSFPLAELDARTLDFAERAVVGLWVWAQGAVWRRGVGRFLVRIRNSDRHAAFFNPIGHDDVGYWFWSGQRRGFSQSFGLFLTRPFRSGWLFRQAGFCAVKAEQRIAGGLACCT